MLEDIKKLKGEVKGFNPIMKEKKEIRQPKKGCLDFNNLPDNYLCSEKKVIFVK